MDTADILERQGDYIGAKSFCERALQGYKKEIGLEYGNTCTMIGKLAVILHRQGDFVCTKALYECALRRKEKLFGLEHPHTLRTVRNLAGLFSSTT